MGERHISLVASLNKSNVTQLVSFRQFLFSFRKLEWDSCMWSHKREIEWPKCSHSWVSYIMTAVILPERATHLGPLLQSLSKMMISVWRWRGSFERITDHVVIVRYIRPFGVDFKAIHFIVIPCWEKCVNSTCCRVYIKRTQLSLCLVYNMWANTLPLPAKISHTFHSGLMGDASKLLTTNRQDASFAP